MVISNVNDDYTKWHATDNDAPKGESQRAASTHPPIRKYRRAAPEPPKNGGNESPYDSPCIFFRSVPINLLMSRAAGNSM